MERTGKKNASENSIAVRRKKTRRKLKKKNEMKKTKNKTGVLAAGAIFVDR